MSETGPDETFRRFLGEGRFMLQRSASGRYTFYPRVAEPGTGAALEWVEASGRGVVHAVTVVRKKPPEPSYNVVLVDLDEGVRMMSRVEELAPEQVSIGLKVRARIIEQDGEPAVVFVPAEA